MNETYKKELFIDHNVVYELNKLLKIEHFGEVKETSVMAKFSVIFDDDCEVLIEVTKFSSGCVQSHGYLYDADGTLVDKTDPQYELDGVWNFHTNGNTYSVDVKPKVVFNKNKNLFLVRGCPGSGKTTFVHKMLDGIFHIENDMFHMKGTDYVWSANNMKPAIDFCLDAFDLAIVNGISVVVSNTFTKRRFVETYVDKAKENGYNVVVFRMLGEFKNIHNVPTETLKNMKEHFDDYPNEVLVYPRDDGRYEFAFVGANDCPSMIVG